MCLIPMRIPFLSNQSFQFQPSTCLALGKDLLKNKRLSLSILVHILYLSPLFAQQTQSLHPSAAKATINSVQKPPPKLPQKPTQKLKPGIHQNSTLQIKPGLQNLPSARRTFSLDLNHDGFHEVFCAHNTQLSVYEMKGKKGKLLWSIQGDGVVYQVLWTQFQGQQQLLIVRGMGKGAMQAPLSLQIVNPLTGQGPVVWTKKTTRNQPLNLHVLQLDSDSDSEYLLAHFVSKYHSEVTLLDGTPAAENPPQLIERARGGRIRMGTSWGLLDLDDHPGLDLYVGRVYGDVKGEYGDLLYYSSKEQGRFPLVDSKFIEGTAEQPYSIPAFSPLNASEVLPTTRGVKHAWVTQVNNRKQLLFADGWVANYGKKAKALLKRVVWNHGRFSVETVAKSDQEFTFFDLFNLVDPTSQKSLIFVRGNKHLSLLTPQKTGLWTQTRLLSYQPIVNLAIGYQSQGWFAYIPQETGVQVRSFTLPAHSKEINPPTPSLLPTSQPQQSTGAP